MFFQAGKDKVRRDYLLVMAKGQLLKTGLFPRNFWGLCASTVRKHTVKALDLSVKWLSQYKQ